MPPLYETVESWIIVRQEGEGTDASPYGPRAADLAPYASLHWEDITARQGIPIEQEQDPRVLVIRGRMSNADALAMAGDNKLWMVESRRYNIGEDGIPVEVENNKDDIYDAGERTTRINQLANFSGFDHQKISDWWTPEKTRREVGIRLRDYLRILE